MGAETYGDGGTFYRMDDTRVLRFNLTGAYLLGGVQGYPQLLPISTGLRYYGYIGLTGEACVMTSGKGVVLLSKFVSTLYGAVYRLAYGLTDVSLFGLTSGNMTYTTESEYNDRNTTTRYLVCFLAFKFVGTYTRVLRGFSITTSTTYAQVTTYSGLARSNSVKVGTMVTLDAKGASARTYCGFITGGGYTMLTTGDLGTLQRVFVGQTYY